MAEEAVLEESTTTESSGSSSSGSLLGGTSDNGISATPNEESNPEASAKSPKSIGLDGLVDENLAFRQGWREALASKLGDSPLAAEIKESKVLEKYKDLPNALKGLIEINKMVGAEKIARPGKDSSQAVWDEYYKAGGKPDAPDQYKLDFTEGMEPDADRLKNIQEMAHKANLSNSQLQAMVAFQEQDYINQQKAQQQIINDEMVKTTNALHQDWGGAFDFKIKKVSNFFNNLGLGDLVNNLGLGRNYEFITAFEEKVIDKLSEDSTLLGAEEPLAPMDIDKQINDALYNPDSAFNRNVPGAQEALDNLYKLRAKNKKGR